MTAESILTITVLFVLATLVVAYMRAPRPEHPAEALFRSSPSKTGKPDAAEALRRLAYQAAGQATVLWASPNMWFQKVSLDESQEPATASIQYALVPNPGTENTRWSRCDELAAVFAGPIAERLAFDDVLTENAPLDEDIAMFLIGLLTDRYIGRRPPGLPPQWSHDDAMIVNNPLLQAIFRNEPDRPWQRWLANRANVRALTIVTHHRDGIRTLADLLLEYGCLTTGDFSRVLGARETNTVDDDSSMTAS